MRTLTITEKNWILESAKYAKKTYGHEKDTDINKDFSVRYMLNGYECYVVMNINNMHEVLVPIDAHICNVYGNMNYVK